MRIVIFSGRRRQAFELLHGRADRRGYAAAIKRAMFPTNGAYHKAKRRGERAMAVAVPA